ncbi:MAG TPA: phosphate-starvation-inducible PsiE family protein [bacterium]|nr:phosphate-starvation-inducible PsiE family protein [bacterium]
MCRGNTFNPELTDVHRLFRRFLEPVQDILMLALGLALFGLMTRRLAELARQLLTPTIEFRTVIARCYSCWSWFALVRRFLIYLQEHQFAVDFMVELGIVATLREVVLRGAVELSREQITALSVFLLAPGFLSESAMCVL